MNKRFLHFAKLVILLSTIYLWPSCDKNDNDQPVTQNDSTANSNDTTQPEPDYTNLKGWVVTTLAGSKTGGYTDGVGAQARFCYPNEITRSTTGELYIFESTKNRDIRKVTLDGQVTTLLKEDSSKGILLYNLAYALSDGAGRFYYPYNFNHIRTVTVNGGSVFAGNDGIFGDKDGLAADARFNHAVSIARDSKGNLYVNDNTIDYKFTIRKITPSGSVSTLVLQNQTGIAEMLSGNINFTLAADSAGNLYYTAGIYPVIKKVDPQGNVSVLAGSTTNGFKDGKGKEAQFNTIVDMDVDAAGNLWVCDARNNAIRKVAPDGTVTTIAGNGTAGYLNGQGDKAQFNYPYAIAIDKSGTMFVLEAYNHALRKIEYRQ